MMHVSQVNKTDFYMDIVAAVETNFENHMSVIDPVIPAIMKRSEDITAKCFIRSFRKTCNFFLLTSY